MTADRGNMARPGDAAGWVARLGSDQHNADDAAHLAEWLDRSPGHRATFGDHSALWNGVGALADDEEARAVLIGVPPSAPAAIGRRRVLGFAAAALGVVAVPAVLWHRSERIAAAARSQRIVRLEDGSVVTLDAGASVDLAFSASERVLHLRRGRAFFEVAPDAARPFRVMVDGSEARALGTGFGVSRDARGASVVLEHGSVALFRTADAGAMPDAIMRPGERAEMRGAAVIDIARVDVGRNLAWRHGRMVFDAAPLAVAITEVNRYDGPRLTFEGTATPDLALSGVFHVGRPEAFVESVVAVLPVRVARREPDRIVLVHS